MEWCATKCCGKIMVWQMMVYNQRPSVFPKDLDRAILLHEDYEVTNTRQQVVLPKVALNHPIRYDLGRSNMCTRFLRTFQC